MSADAEGPTSSRWPTRIAIAAVAVVIAQVVLIAFHDRWMACDDAYISFRYAENLQLGHGLRWNPDTQPSEGYTNLLHILLVAGFASLGLGHEAAAAGVSAASAVGIAALLLFAARGARGWYPVACLPAALFALDPYLPIHASRGLETVLFAALLVTAVVALARHVAQPARRAAIPVAVAATVAAFLARPDGVLATGIAWLTALALLSRHGARRRSALLGLGTVVAAGLAYGGWKLAYFGHLLPTPFYMKGSVDGFAGLAETRAFLDAYWLPLVLLVALGLRARFGPARRPDARTAVIAMVLVIAVAWLAYSAKILHEIGFGHRFAYPLVPLAWLGIAAGMSRASESLRDARWTPWLALGLFATCLALQLPTLRHRHWHLARPEPTEAYTSTYLRLGEAIGASRFADRITLLCSHAGATPYASKVRHVDSGGLTDANLSKRYPEEHRRRYLAALEYDVGTAHLFPASAGATDFANDPRCGSSYLHEWFLADSEGLDASARVDRKGLTSQQRRNRLHSRMRALRDEHTLVGEMNTGLERWRIFVYVSKSSPVHDELVTELGPRMDISADAIEWDGWPD